MSLSPKQYLVTRFPDGLRLAEGAWTCRENAGREAGGMP
jgi:hypothetical protein